MRPLNIVYIQPFCKEEVWLVPNEKSYLCKQEEKALCNTFSDQIKLQLKKDNIVVVEDSDIQNPECISFSLVSVSHVCLLPFHFVYCVPNSSLVFLNELKKI